ncbi:response regulator, partial [Sphingobium sp. Z007]|uniref:response regulator n=1 Tax=Sphingobium sp. Z007 TaxID=627495 RepID=UPI0020CF6E09
MARDGVPMLMLIDDEPAQRRLVSALGARAGWRTIFAADDGETAIATLGTQDGMQLDAIILDQWSPDYEPSGLIREIRSRRPALPILILTAHNNVAIAVEAMRAGATDYLSKPIAPERLLAALNATLAEGAAAGELRPLTEKITAPLSFEDVVGSAPQFRAALAIAAKAARARVPVLIEGESGV